MVNINEEFPSKYLKSADLRGTVQKVKIHDVVVEEIGSDRKLVMYFENREKGMVLNKTNARTIGEIYGDDTDAWIGVPLEVFSMKVDYQGKMVDGLRLRVPPPRKQGNDAAPARTPVMSNAGGDEWQAPPGQARAEDDFDDEVPF